MARGLQVTVDGGEALQARLRALEEQAPKAAAGGLYAVGLAIMANAVMRTPKRTGVLRSSGYVSVPDGEGTQTQLTLGFGGPAAAYAVVQHENTAYHHKEGESHYLTNAIAAVLPQAVDIFTATVARLLRSHGQRVQVSGEIPTDPNQGMPAASGGHRHPGRDGTPPRRKAGVTIPRHGRRR